MIKTNRKMRQRLIGTVSRQTLDPALKALAASGFAAIAGCHFLSGLLPRTESVARDDFPDAVGYECFVNSIHIDDFDVAEPLLQAVLFVDEVFERWKMIWRDKILVAIVSSDDDSVVVKFHLKREGQKWLADDLDGNLDGILVAEVSPQPLADRLHLYLKN